MALLSPRPRSGVRRWLRSAACVLALGSAPTMAQLSVAVAPDALALGGASRLTLRLSGDAGKVREGVAFSVDLPDGITLTSPVVSSLDCPGSLSAAPGGNRIEVAGVAQSTGQACTVTAFIEAESAGSYDLQSSQVSVDGAAPIPAAMANLSVIENDAFLSLNYSSPTARWRDRLSLTYTIDASSAVNDLTSLRINDRLPPGWTFVEDQVVESSCSGGLPESISAVGRDFSVASAFVAASETCDYTVQVNAGSVGLRGHVASLASGSSLAPPTQHAVAGVDVSSDALHLSHVFDGLATPGGKLGVVYTLNNASTADVTAIAFSQDLDATLSGLVRDGPATFTDCGPGASLAGTSQLSFTGGQLARGNSCSVVVPVSVPADAMAGDYASVTSVATATLAGVDYTAPAPSSAILSVADRPILSREFLPDTAADGSTVTLEYTLRNTSDSTLTDFAFTDDHGAFLGGYVQTPSPGSCGAGSFSEADSWGSILYARSLTIPPGDSCTFEVQLRLSAPAGDIRFASIAAKGSIDGVVRQALVSGDRLRVLRAPPAQLSLSAPQAGAGESTQLLVTMGDLNTITDRDVPLPAYSDLSWELDVTGIPVSIATALPLTDVCGAGSQLARSGDRVILSGAILSSGRTCEIALDMDVHTDATAGEYDFSLQELSARQDGVAVSGTNQSITLGVDALVIVVTTSAQPVAPGSSLSLLLRFINPSDVSDVFDLSGTLDLQRALPGTTVDAVNVETTDCPTLTASNSSGATVVFDIDTLAAGVRAGCVVGVDITLDADIAPDNYALNLNQVSAAYGDVYNGYRVTVQPGILSVVAQGEPRDLSPLALSEGDPDEDGATTAQEQSVGDGNGDGIPDALQDTVASGSAADGISAITVAVPPGEATVSGFSTLETPGDAPQDVVFPHGFVGFQVSGVTPASSQTISVHIPYNPDINGYWKQDRNGDWADIATSITHSEAAGRTVITLRLLEGGLYDIESPNVPNTITDPGGPGALPPTEPQAIPLFPRAMLLMTILFLAGLVVRFSERR